MKSKEHEFYQLVKQKMQELRKRHKLTQSEVADKLGVTVQHYQQIETGSTDPNLRIIVGLSDIYDVHPSYFFNTQDISIINKDGKVVIEDLYIQDVIAFQSSAELSDEAKRSVAEYVRFKHFEEQERKARERKGDVDE